MDSLKETLLQKKNFLLLKKQKHDKLEIGCSYFKTIKKLMMFTKIFSKTFKGDNSQFKWILDTQYHFAMKWENSFL